MGPCGYMVVVVVVAVLTWLCSIDYFFGKKIHKFSNQNWDFEIFFFSFSDISRYFAWFNLFTHTHTQVTEKKPGFSFQHFFSHLFVWFFCLIMLKYMDTKWIDPAKNKKKIQDLILTVVIKLYWRACDYREGLTKKLFNILIWECLNLKLQKKISCSKKMNDGINLIHSTVAMGKKILYQ